ncbi:GNAT family N-acetyltransferase [Polaribacter uvawellassae]|uniref:GNAT family N-acetyltransferase n=1 Tax=Polaribacter uvawellassae TaxID=3133495 RepID=UPI00321B3E04
MINFDIKTERLNLLTPKQEDKFRFYELMSNNNLTEFLTWEAHKDVLTTEKVLISLKLAQESDKGYHWAIHFKNQIVGLISLIDVKRTIRTWTINKAELSYWIAKDFQGKGFATEASQAVIDFGFKELKLHKIIIAHAKENYQSSRICEKLKFEQFSYEKDAFLKDKKWHDLIWYQRINK